MGYDLRGAVESLFSRRYEGYSQTWPGTREYLVVSTFNTSRYHNISHGHHLNYFG